jgi:DNA repair exonuclease SbcCD ATPase subunit
MTYRDDLEAAHARIEALQEELATHGTDEDRAKILEEVKQLRQILEERRATIKELRNERDQLQKRIDKLQAGASLPSVWEHNREFEPLTGIPANVACPICRAAGREVTMIDETKHGFSTKELRPVTCPRCAFTASLRTG